MDENKLKIVDDYLNNNYNDPENITLEEFRNIVKKWINVDNSIKKDREILKKKISIKNDIENIITQWMIKYDIEELNTKEGKIRCKKVVSKQPVAQKRIKETINDYFKNEEETRIQLMNKIYGTRNIVEKVGLRRLKIQ